MYLRRGSARLGAALQWTKNPQLWDKRWRLVPPQVQGWAYRDVVCLFGWAFGDVENMRWYLTEEKSQEYKETLLILRNLWKRGLGK